MVAAIENKTSLPLDNDNYDDSLLPKTQASPANLPLAPGREDSYFTKSRKGEVAWRSILKT